MPRYEFRVYELARKEVHMIDADASHDALREFQQSVDLNQLMDEARAESSGEIEGFLVEMLDENGQKTGSFSVRRNPNEGRRQAAE